MGLERLMLTPVVRAEVAPLIRTWRRGVAVLATPMVSSIVLATALIPVHMMSVEAGWKMQLSHRGRTLHVNMWSGTSHCPNKPNKGFFNEKATSLFGKIFHLAECNPSGDTQSIAQYFLVSCMERLENMPV